MRRHLKNYFYESTFSSRSAASDVTIGYDVNSVQLVRSRGSIGDYVQYDCKLLGPNYVVVGFEKTGHDRAGYYFAGGIYCADIITNSTAYMITDCGSSRIPVAGGQCGVNNVMNVIQGYGGFTDYYFQEYDKHGNVGTFCRAVCLASLH